jgi:hypothetical protein
MFADRNHDLAAAIDDRGTGPREPWIEDELDNRDGQQRNEEDARRSHVFLHSPGQWNLPSMGGQEIFSRSLTKMYTSG